MIYNLSQSQCSHSPSRVFKKGKWPQSWSTGHEAGKIPGGLSCPANKKKHPFSSWDIFESAFDAAGVQPWEKILRMTGHKDEKCQGPW